MKFLVFLFSILSFLAFSQKNFQILSSNPSELVVKFNLSAKDFSTKEVNEISYLDVTTQFKNFSLEKGNPSLPIFGETFMIPLTGAQELEIISADFYELSNVNVLPSKGNLKRNVDPTSVAYEFGEAYSKNEFFPQKIGFLQDEFNLRTIRGQVLNVQPLQYNPVTKTLRYYTSIEFKIKNMPNIQGKNELNTVINPSDIEQFKSVFSSSNLEKYDAVQEEGEMLIISPQEYVATLTNFINWKNKKGIKTSLKTTEEIGASTTEIKDFISLYYQTNPNLKYIILAGDADKVPAYSYGNNFGEELISDSYYGQLTGTDYYPEVFVGRLSGTDADLKVMIDRILEYETNPMAGSWTSKALGLASSEGAGFGDENQADWQHMRGLRNLMLDFGYEQVYEFYDGNRGEEDLDGSPSSQSILDAVNAGVSLFNYTGHGDLNTCITGNFGSNHINQATNNGMYPFVISVACNNGTFVDANCLAETWLKATNNNTPSGAIAACASSILMAWAPPMETQDEMTLINTQAYIDNQKTSLGGLFYNGQMSMLEEYLGNGEEVMQTWVFFGDPSVELRNKTTLELIVNHVSQVTANELITTVMSSVTEGALISLSANNEFITKENIASSLASLNLPMMELGTVIDVVATKQNYKPYIGHINVVQNAGLNENLKSNYVVYPNPSRDNLKISSKVPMTNLKIVDATGQTLLEKKNLDSLSAEFDINSLASGLYQLLIESKDGTTVKSFSTIK